jgi:hypothetical protein
MKTIAQKYLKPINFYLILLSLTAVLISIERYSLTTKILLQPFDFLRLHEAIQMGVLTLASIVISFFIFRHTTNSFELLKTKKGIFLGLLFFIGTYLYATGNALHEIASFFYNTYCPVNTAPANLCSGLFINDYYLGNSLYFIGIILTNIVIICFELQKPARTFTNKDMPIMALNSLVYALGLFAYAAFDKVSIGIIFITLATLIVNVLLFLSRKPMRILPFTSYCAIAYTLAFIASIIFRFH